MKQLFNVIGLVLLGLFVQATAATAATCTNTDKVVIATWPPNLYGLPIYEAMEGGLADEYCLEIDWVYMKSIGQFDVHLQKGVPDATFIATDLTSFMANRDRTRRITGEESRLVGFLSNSTYGLFMRAGTTVEPGSRIAIVRCGWQNRDLTEPLPPSEMSEALSYQTLVILSWLRAEGHNIWCGNTPPADFEGVQLVPVGISSYREAAFSNPENGIDGMMQTIERSTIDTVGADPRLVQVAGPEDMRRPPESPLVARTTCLADSSCRDVVQRTVDMLLEARTALAELPQEELAARISAMANSVEGGSPVRGASDPDVALTLAAYVQAEVLSQHFLTRVSVEQLIADYGWDDVEPEDLVDLDITKLE